MKNLWNAIVIICLANVLALGGLVGWLVVSDRLDSGRVRDIRAMLAVTLGEEQAEADLAVQEAAAAEATLAEAARTDGEPVSAQENIRNDTADEEVKRQQFARQAQEIRTLRESLALERREVDERWTEILAREQEFRDYRERLRETEGSEQFKRALKTLEGQKPKAAMSMLQSLLGTGKEEEVVAYLNFMQERPRNKVFAELEKEDSTMAAFLLERLRTRGVEAVASGDAADEPTGDGGLTGAAQ